MVRFVRWQVGSRILPGQVVVKWVNDTILVVGSGEQGLTGNVYCGLHEFADMAFVIHLLRPEDLFVDVGANAGSYTVLACGVAGASGICFEPVPEAFSRLSRNVSWNGLAGRVRCLNTGVGEQKGTLRFTSGSDTTNHVLGDGDSQQTAIEVPVISLDEALGDEVPYVIKIDVEGYELPVLRGAGRTLENPGLGAVVMELNGSGARYGFNESDILTLMRNYDFETFSYEPFDRRLVALDGKNLSSGNTLFVRDPESVAARLLAGVSISVLDSTF